jgi:hypothetical protein
MNEKFTGNEKPKKYADGSYSLTDGYESDGQGEIDPGQYAVEDVALGDGEKGEEPMDLRTDVEGLRGVLGNMEFTNKRSVKKKTLD